MKKLLITFTIYIFSLLLTYVLGWEIVAANIFYSPYTYVAIFGLLCFLFLIENLDLKDDTEAQGEYIEHIHLGKANTEQKYYDLINNIENQNKKKLDRYETFICNLRTYALKEMGTSDEHKVYEMINELETDLKQN